MKWANSFAYWLFYGVLFAFPSAGAALAARGSGWKLAGIFAGTLLLAGGWTWQTNTVEFQRHEAEEPGFGWALRWGVRLCAVPAVVLLFAMVWQNVLPKNLLLAPMLPDFISGACALAFAQWLGTLATGFGILGGRNDLLECAVATTLAGLLISLELVLLASLAYSVRDFFRPRYP